MQKILNKKSPPIINITTFFYTTHNTYLSVIPKTNNTTNIEHTKQQIKIHNEQIKQTRKLQTSENVWVKQPHHCSKPGNITNAKRRLNRLQCGPRADLRVK